MQNQPLHFDQPIAIPRDKTGTMEDLAMLKKLLATVLGLFSLTSNASQLVRLDVDQHANSYTVYVEMELDASAEKVRAILTDYAHLGRLNASITASEITDARDDGTVRVLTRFKNCILFFCLTVQRVEDITEDVHGRILLALVPDASSFRSGQASWEVKSIGSGSRVIHRATLEPNFWLPPWIGTTSLKATLRREIRASFENLECLTRTNVMSRQMVQTALAAEHQLKAPHEVTKQVDDQTRLSPMAVQAREMMDNGVLAVVADAGDLKRDARLSCH